MSVTKSFLLASAFALLACAAPSKTLPRQACTTVYPTAQMPLYEAAPDRSDFPGDDFFISTADGQTDRIYQVLEFGDIPAGAYGCSLNFDFSNFGTGGSTAHATVNVRTLGIGQLAAIDDDELCYSWNDLFGPKANGLVGDGVFGTSGPFNLGSSGVINSESCPTDLNGGGNLAFVFSIADWIQTAEALDMSNPCFFLTYNC